MEKLLKAKFSQLRNDMYWELYEMVTTTDHKVTWDKLRWVGYDDEYWWTNVATQDSFQVQIGASGRKYRLDPKTHRVTAES